MEEENGQFLDQGLHQNPTELNRCIGEALSEAERHSPQTIILFYGFCGGGLEDLYASRSSLIVAGSCDCIPLLLGREPERIGPEGKGIYFVSRGWMKYSKHLYLQYLDLKERFGHEDAYWSCKELLKQYNRVVSIQTVPDSSSSWRRAAEKFAAFFHMEFSEVNGDMRLLERLARGEPGEGVLKFKPGQRLGRGDFAITIPLRR